MKLLKKLAGWLRAFLKYTALLLVPLFLVFVLGEQVESWRLGAIAACEGAKDPGNCMRQRAYLPGAPYYPDITRRLVGGYARLVGGWLGASYAPPPPPPPADEE